VIQGPSTRTQRGFTLIEVMVVLSLLAMLAQGLYMSIGALQSRGGGRAVGARGRRRGGERAWTRGQPLALERTPQGYRFLARDTAGGWQQVSDSSVLAERRLPDALRWSALEVEGRNGTAETLLILGPDSPSFRLELTDASGWRATLGDLNGRVELLAGTMGP
jgi:general secretion pathway protein H